MKRIGTIVWWSLRVKKQEPLVEELIRLAQKYNIEDCVPDGVGGLRWAVVRACNGYYNPGREYFIKAAQRATKTGVTYTILESRSQETNDQFQTRVKPIAIDRLHYRADDNGEHLYLEFGTPVGSELKAEIYRLVGRVTHDEIRYFIIDFIHRVCNGISLRKTGGIFFIPDEFSEILQEMKHDLESLGPGIVIYTVPQYEDSQDAYRESAQEMLLKEVVEFHQRVKQFASDPKTRKSTMEKRLAEFKALKDRALYYAEILNVMADDMVARLEEAKAMIAKNLG